MTDLSLFLGQFLRRPDEVRAVAPTGAAVAREMARHIPDGAEAVAEIGAGTGTITRAILERGIAPAALELYELNAAFCDRLRVAFPGCKVVNAPAQTMALGGGPLLDAVVSGVPVLALPEAAQAGIVGAALARMRPGAPFVQITYGTRPPLCPAVRARFGLRHARSPRIWANLPPAQVWVFRAAPAAPR